MVYPCLKETLAHITNTLDSDCLFFFELNFIEGVLLDLVFWMCFLVVLRSYCVQSYNSSVCNTTTAFVHSAAAGPSHRVVVHIYQTMSLFLKAFASFYFLPGSV